MYIAATANPPDRVPALFARFLVGPVFFQDPAFIGKNAGGERKGDAVFLLVRAVLSFLPFQPHVYIVYIYSVRRSKGKSNSRWPPDADAAAVGGSLTAPRCRARPAVRPS